jgi:hypothetical protein
MNEYTVQSDQSIRHDRMTYSITGESIASIVIRKDQKD